MMTWINVAILVLFIVISAIIAYRLGKAYGIATILFTLNPDIVKEWMNELIPLHERITKKGMSPTEKIKFQTLLRICVRKFLFG